MTIAVDIRTGQVVGQVLRPVSHPISIRPRELVVLTRRGIETVRCTDIRLETVDSR